MKSGRLMTRLYDVTIQKTSVFIFTAKRTLEIINCGVFFMFLCMLHALPHFTLDVLCTIRKKT